MTPKRSAGYKTEIHATQMNENKENKKRHKCTQAIHVHGLNIKARDPFCHSHIPHELTSTLHAIVCTPVLVTDTEDVYDVII